MAENRTLFCPECDEHVHPAEVVDRREFIQLVGGGAASVVAAGSIAAAVPAMALGQTATPQRNERQPRPAEALIQELYGTLSDEQKRAVVMPWDHGAGENRLPTRMRMYNAPIGQRIEQVYNRPQRELVERILRSISSGDDGYRRISRDGTFDGSQSFEACGAYIFGDPTQGRYAWVFTGHHLTVRCDGNSEPGAAFGGPIYYGHSPNGYSQRNIFYYQTQSVRSVFDALSEQQRRQAVVTGTPGEQEPSIRFRPANQPHPGTSAGELSEDQRRLVERVMRDILSPFRQEDADEVMQIVRQNGGIERIHLAFYRDPQSNDDARWHFWRLEGPGFVWNYRVLPHVHTYVNIASRT